MFQKEISDFGPFNLYRFIHYDSGNGFELTPAFGGTLLQVHFGNIPLLDGYAGPDELAAYDWAKSAILAPFSNRLRGGSFRWQGKAYSFPINEPSTGTALHGFSLPQDMEVFEESIGQDHADIRCLMDYAGDQLAFPFPFRLEVGYRMNLSGEFIMSLKARNTGNTDIPLVLGWHPYFRLPGDLSEWELTLPECRFVEVDEERVPTGKKQAFTIFREPLALGKVLLDNCFALKADGPGRARLQLRSSEGVLEYWQETGFRKFNYLQLFIPPGRQSLAIEPMTGNIDAFNNQDGLISLPPGEEFQASCGFSFRK